MVIHVSKRRPNNIWLLCLIPNSTTGFACELGYRMAKILIALYKENTPICVVSDTFVCWFHLKPCGQLAYLIVDIIPLEKICTVTRSNCWNLLKLKKIAIEIRASPANFKVERTPVTWSNDFAKTRLLFLVICVRPWWTTNLLCIIESLSCLILCFDKFASTTYYTILNFITFCLHLTIEYRLWNKCDTYAE